MKLYNLDNSPFAARVRMQIRHKKLPVTVCAPDLVLRSPEFKAAFPLGKVPVLDLLDGNTIGESTAIMNYLEAEFPTPPLRPIESLARAQDEMLIRYVDNHLTVGLSPLFKEFFQAVHSGAKVKPNNARFDLLMVELDKLDRLLDALPDFTNRELQLGDLCVASNLYYVVELAKYFDKDKVLAGFGNIEAWQQWVGRYEAVSHEIDVMDIAHQAMLASLAESQGKRA